MPFYIILIYHYFMVSWVSSISFNILSFQMLAISGLGIGVISSIVYAIHGVQSVYSSCNVVVQSWTVILHQNIGVIWALMTGLWSWVMLDLAKDLNDLVYVEELIMTCKTKSLCADAKSTKLLIPV